MSGRSLTPASSHPVSWQGVMYVTGCKAEDWQAGLLRVGAPSATCGAEGSRTPDLSSAIQALSQLSYSPRRLRRLGLRTSVSARRARTMMSDTAPRAGGPISGEVRKSVQDASAWRVTPKG